MLYKISFMLEWGLAAALVSNTNVFFHTVNKGADVKYTQTISVLLTEH